MRNGWVRGDEGDSVRLTFFSESSPPVSLSEGTNQISLFWEKVTPSKVIFSLPEKFFTIRPLVVIKIWTPPPPHKFYHAHVW